MRIRPRVPAWAAHVGVRHVGIAGHSDSRRRKYWSCPGARLVTVLAEPNPASTGAAAATIITNAIARAGQMATLPQLALEVIRLAEDPRSSGKDLERVLSSDPTLSARVLRIVNSAFYGVRREVASVGTGIAVLGFAAVKNIAIAASLARMFRAGALPGGFQPKDLWTHSIGVATASQLIVGRVRGVDPSDAFLAGLMHDIGLIIEMQSCREQFVAVLADVNANPALTFRKAELRNIGATHEAFGEALARAWRFPIALQRVNRWHHSPLQLPPEERQLAAIVHVADHLAAAANIGYSRTVETAEPDAEVLAWLGLTAADMDNFAAALPALVSEVGPLLTPTT